MDEKKRQKLEQDGWKVGSTEEFLELSPEEANYIELKLALAPSAARKVITSPWSSRVWPGH